MSHTTHKRKTRLIKPNEQRSRADEIPKPARLPEPDRATERQPASEKKRVEKILCAGAGCAIAVAELHAGCAIAVRARHHGERHFTIIEPPREKLSSPQPMGGKKKFEKIRCDKTGCNDIVAARRADGAIVFRVWHRGEEHVTVIEPRLLAPQKDLVADAVAPVAAPDISILEQ